MIYTKKVILKDGTEKIYSYKKDYSGKINCKICNKLVSRYNMNKHNKTKKCTNFLNYIDSFKTT
jgi:hypothetical protein